ncbi:MAG: lysylphosphatidylglycerol synthase transmembrane domain-containing protein, partial [Fibrobacteria bacterium]
MPQIKTLGKHPLVTALKWLLAAGAIWLVIQKVPLAGIGPALASARLGPLLGSLTAIFVSSILNAYRWRALLRAPDLGVTKYLYFIFVGHFFNLFMPSAVAAEAVKVVAFGKRYGNLQQNIGVTLVARGMGLLAQLGIGAIAFSLYFRELSRSGLYSRLNAPWLVLGLAIAAGVAAAAAVFAFRRGLAAQPWVQAIVAASRNRSLMVKTAGLTLGIQALSAISGYCLFLSVFPDAPFGKVLLFILIIQAILMIPFSLGGVGVREYLVYLFFSQLGGMPREAVLAANLLGYVPLILLSLTGGAWILFRRHGPML